MTDRRRKSYMRWTSRFEADVCQKLIDTLDVYQTEQREMMFSTIRTDFQGILEKFFFEHDENFPNCDIDIRLVDRKNGISFCDVDITNIVEKDNEFQIIEDGKVTGYFRFF